MEKENTLNLRVRDFSTKSEIIQVILYFLLAFLVPTFLANLITIVFGANSVIASNSQLIIGSIVNALLIVSAFNLKGFGKVAAVCTAPSISSLFGRYVFNSGSPYLLYMIPAIWLGNFALVYAFKAIKVKRNSNYILAAIIGIVIKVAIIFGCFLLLNGVFHLFPEKVSIMFSKAMGITQVITATIGSILAYVVYKLETK